MSILFSGQQLADVFLLQNSMFSTFCFQQEMSFFILLELDLITESFQLNEILIRHCFWAFKKS